MPEEQSFSHVPVMLHEVLEWLSPQPGQVVIDGTLGLGGHALRLSEYVGPQGLLIGIDRDNEAISHAHETLASAPSRVSLVKSRYSEMDTVIERLQIDGVDRILIDIGVSSLQLDKAERGFSFQKNGPLDMRMDTTSGVTAAHLIATLSTEDLADVFYQFGEERHSRRIAKRITEKRVNETINTTEQLAQIVAEAMPRRGRIHPATRVFQALRIVVNDELAELETGLDVARRCLKPEGRLAVITFHSLEDRLVKRVFRAWHESGECTLLRRKVIKPSAEECRGNRRSRSAKLRVIELV